ncbi:bifunctional aspartate kinase/homoserine dehydrogenase I [Robertkochia aurantiaca]|uniref:bifunctional aspartate kinase/homoserine dehydrogenase I n=1 Tax=Robertkochia aurantiaca TaxID=2873700 RepID=UPI001CCC6868|nr:bifunctional aspartate kinase/homoserine dehydrogenase I [Robertkochia sp. 3YJGBD-33]
MKVLKFGGTSVANHENIKKVKEIISSPSYSEKRVVVVSALGGVTDQLIEASHLAALQDESFRTVLSALEERHFSVIRELFPAKNQSPVTGFVKKEFNVLETLLEGAFLIGELTPKLTDKIVSYGELLSSFIIAEYFKESGVDCIRKDSRDLIITDDRHENARVNFEKTNILCENYFRTVGYDVVVIPGFVASSSEGHTTTLGRGGSDYTAAIVAGAVNATQLEIWTDVSGMYTANPKLVKQARAIPLISYQEAMELSHFGAKVLYPPTIQPVLKRNIPIRICNTFDPESEGTLIKQQANGNERPVRGISHIENISLISLEGSGMVGIPGISKRFFEVLSGAGISVVMITQASSEHSICIAVASPDAQKAKNSLDDSFAYEIALGKINPATVESDMAILALVGDKMKSHQGLSGRMFSSMGRNNVNIRAIAQGASERNISAVIMRNDVKKALNTLHEEFFEEQVKQLNLFVIGVGNVGRRFLEQIRNQKSFLKKEMKLNVRITGIANSKKMFFSESGISLENWTEKLEQGVPMSLEAFHEKVLSMNLRNSIFVDNTATDKVAATYETYLKNSIAVVTCNKIAASSSFDRYKRLKDLSKRYNAPFLFETNVGAGLPIIDTIKNLVASGDRINEIQAVLSGSLNFVFNNFNGKKPFHEIVEIAMEEGYTEPDPKIDLSGIDVMRKILILARESGYSMELEDIRSKDFLPGACMKTTDNSSFFKCLQEHKEHFDQLLEEATQARCRLKYVATLKDGQAEAGLQQVPSDHPFYNLEGKDNIVLLYTERYKEQPLLIKGAGAGADVTASGLFADIIRIGNY